ncbi:UNVERIFIED_CONTAM: hypothetical protein FKN15_077144 [Acipenser sinensis]
MDNKQNADGPNPVTHGASADSMDISSAVNPVNPLTTSLPYPAVATTTVVDTPTVCTVTISQPLGPTVSTGSQPSVRARIHRERQIPQYLSDYDLGYHPSRAPSTTQHARAPQSEASRSRSCQSRKFDIASQRSSRITQLSSRTARSHASSTSLRDSQSAILREERKRAELEELKRQIAEDNRADEQYRQLDYQAREALRQREMITQQLLRERRLRKVERQLEEAQMITSFIKENEQSEGITSLSGDACAEQLTITSVSNTAMPPTGHQQTKTGSNAQQSTLNAEATPYPPASQPKAVGLSLQWDCTTDSSAVAQPSQPIQSPIWQAPTTTGTDPGHNVLPTGSIVWFFQPCGASPCRMM